MNNRASNLLLLRGRGTSLSQRLIQSLLFVPPLQEFEGFFLFPYPIIIVVLLPFSDFLSERY